MANYTIDRSLTAAGSITVTEATTDTSTNVTLVGQNYTGYGDEIATNFLQMLENFAADVEPNNNPRVPGSSAITGQLWYDTANSVLKVFGGTTWEEQAKANAGSAENSTIRWNNTNKRWQEEERVRISDAGSLQIAFDGTTSNQVNFNHGGTNLVATFTGTTDFTLSGLTGDLTLVGPAANQGGLSVEHDGTALAIRADGTTDVINITAAAATAINMPAGVKVNTAATGASRAGFALPHGTAPSAPVNGDLWTTSSGVFARVNGSTVQLDSTAGGTVTASGSPLAGMVSTFTSGTDITGSTSLTFSGGTLAVTGDITATGNIAGIANGNLIDRSAPGTISGNATFSGASPITATAGDITVNNGFGFTSTDGAYGIGIRADTGTGDIQFTHSSTPDWNISGLGQILVDGASLFIDNENGEAIRLQGNFTTSSLQSYITFRDSGNTIRSQIGIIGTGSNRLRVDGGTDGVDIYGTSGLVALQTTTALIGRHSGNNSAFITQNPTTNGNTTSLTIYDGRDVTTGSGGYDVGFNGTPAAAAVTTGTYVIAYDDIGKYIPVTGSSVTISLPADANIPVGGSFIVHNDGTGSVTITETTGTTNAIEHIDGSGSDSTATSYSLARNSICTIRKKDGTRWQIWGNGIS
jgi:hypothetical protein